MAVLSGFIPDVCHFLFESPVRLPRVLACFTGGPKERRRHAHWLKHVSLRSSLRAPEFSSHRLSCSPPSFVQGNSRGLSSSGIGNFPWCSADEFYSHATTLSHPVPHHHIASSLMTSRNTVPHPA